MQNEKARLTALRCSLCQAICQIAGIQGWTGWAQALPTRSVLPCKTAKHETKKHKNTKVQTVTKAMKERDWVIWDVLATRVINWCQPHAESSSPDSNPIICKKAAGLMKLWPKSTCLPAQVRLTPGPCMTSTTLLINNLRLFLKILLQLTSRTVSLLLIYSGMYSWI